MIKTVPKKRKCKKAKWLSEEALQIADKWSETKGKGEKEEYIHLNAEFQRIARRDKKAFLCDQCKEMEESNRMGKTRDLFKKIRDTKETFHASSVQSLSRVQLFVTPWTAAHQASRSITNSMSIESVMPSNHLILSSLSPPTFNISQHQGLFQWVSSCHQVAKLLEFQLQLQSYQWTPRTDLL